MICELCSRDTGEDHEFHHLYPGKQRRSKKDKNLHNDGINVCLSVVDQIHIMFTNQQLRDHYNTLDALKSNMETYINWVKDKPISSRFSVKKLKRRK